MMSILLLLFKKEVVSADRKTVVISYQPKILYKVINFLSMPIELTIKVFPPASDRREWVNAITFIKTNERKTDYSQLVETYSDRGAK